MSLTLEEIEKIAHLARLAISPEDMPRYSHDLSNILALVAKMNAADTHHITPMSHPLDVSQRFRSDEISEPNQRKLFQKIAPKLTEEDLGLYLVPQFIE